MIEDLLSGIQADKNSAIVEASTKLVLDWADQKRPASKDELAAAIKLIIQAYNSALSDGKGLESPALAGVVKSATRLTSYWFNQNKSADLEQLGATIEQFVGSVLAELKK